jgi:hypothetical protein
MKATKIIYFKRAKARETVIVLMARERCRRKLLLRRDEAALLQD